MYLEKLEDLYMLNTDSMRKEIDVLEVNEFDAFMALIEHDYDIFNQKKTIEELKSKIKNVKEGSEKIYYRGVPIKIIQA